ncbi:MAG: hypothetical protein N4A44_03795 [Alphaproteobacteria bacterium]|jgi:hypothetical protein|nr:hypothetical protein [Alphaproteobacteria bacterium]
MKNDGEKNLTRGPCSGLTDEIDDSVAAVNPFCYLHEEGGGDFPVILPGKIRHIKDVVEEALIKPSEILSDTSFEVIDEGKYFNLLKKDVGYNLFSKVDEEEFFEEYVSEILVIRHNRSDFIENYLKLTSIINLNRYGAFNSMEFISGDGGYILKNSRGERAVMRANGEFVLNFIKFDDCDDAFVERGYW